MASLKLLAAARNLSKQKELDKKRKEQEEASLIQKIVSQLPQAPTMDDIIKHIPQPINKTEVVKEVHTKEIEKPLDQDTIRKVVEEQLAKNKELDENDNRPVLPEIKVIREEMDTEGFVTKKEMDDWLKQINRAILANAGGGGLAKQVERTLDQRVDDLVSELTDLLSDIATNTEALDRLEEFFERTVSAIEANREELELLNARTEEAYETTITKEDLE